MRHLVFILILFWQIDTFAQIEYFNHNDCDRFTIRSWDKEKVESIKNLKNKHKLTLSNYYNFNESLTDPVLLRNLKSNIVINDLIIFNSCFVANCECYGKKRLDTINQVFSAKLDSTKIKILGSFRPSKNIKSIIVLVQTAKYSTDCYDCKELNSYLLNFDNAHKIISSAFLGKFEEINDGLSFSSRNTIIFIKKNILTTINEECLYPIDIAFHLPKSDFTTKTTDKICITENGSIEKVK